MVDKTLSQLVKGHNIPAKYKFGVEIEVEGCNNELPAFQCWTVTEDASLRNNGKEFVSVPFFIEDTEAVLKDVSSVLKKCEANARCGVHVHTSVESLSLKQYMKLLLYYMVYEPVIFKVAGCRENNSFCVPLSGSDFQRRFADVFEFISDYAGLRGLIQGSGQKYYALNVLPTINADYCTVEFRHHKGTTDTSEVKKFITLISNLLDIVYNDNNTVQELLTELCNINTVSNYEEVLSRLIVNTGYDIRPDSYELRTAIRKSVFNLRVAFNKLKL